MLGHDLLQCCATKFVAVLTNYKLSNWKLMSSDKSILSLNTATDQSPDITKDHGLTLQWQDCVAHTSLRVWIYKLCIAQKNLSIYPYPQKSEWPHNFFAKTVNPSIQLLFAEYMLGIVNRAIYIL